MKHQRCPNPLCTECQEHEDRQRTIFFLVLIPLLALVVWLGRNQLAEIISIISSAFSR